MGEKILKKRIMFISLFLFILISLSSISAAEINDLGANGAIDNVAINDDANSLEYLEDTGNVENDILGSEENIVSSDRNIMSSLGDSQILKTEREFNGTSFSELSAEIINCNENDTIILMNDLSRAAGTVSSPINIYKPITIDGNGHTLDAQNTSSIFWIQRADVTLKNLILKNSVNMPALRCFDTYGGTGFNVHIINCTFIDNNVNDSPTPNGAAIYSQYNCIIESSTFINNVAAKGLGGAIYSSNANFSISGCDFYNNSAYDGGAIYSNNSQGTIDGFSKFIANNASNNGGALYLNSSKETNITYSSFFNNSASKSGGVLYSINSICNIDTGFFINSTASKGGTAVFENSTSLIDYSHFDYNVANGYAGALLLNNSNSSIKYSIFEYNCAGERGAAIYFATPQNNSVCNISSSQFLNNKAKSYNLTAKIDKGIFILKFLGWNNYINAIYAESVINFTDVTYWNGNLTNTDNEFNISGNSGQNITLEIYNSQNSLLRNVTLVTNDFSEQYYDAYDLDDGNYKYKAYHSNDTYYTYAGVTGNFSLNRNPSSINLQIEDYDEFIYNNCSILFDIVNRTTVRYIISNENGSIVYRNATVEEYSRTITVDLGAGDEYYKITVYNLANGIYRESEDSKFFKILKANSSISISPIADIQYEETINVNLVVENKNIINITVYDENQSIVYTVVTENDTVSLPRLAVGTYNVTATNIENDYVYESSNSTIFNVIKADNIVSIFATNVTYGNETLINITAHGDGIYVLDINGTTWNVPVLGHVGRILIPLPAGDYFANASFDNVNYDTIVTGTAFNVLKAENIVSISADNVTYGDDVVLSVSAEADGTYLLDVNGTSYNVTVKEGNGRIAISLPVGEYYVNGTFDNLNYDSSISNDTFNVFKANNIVSVSADNVAYGDDIVIIISAQADGIYLLDVNGTLDNVTVVDGKGILEKNLPLGKYYANATFNNTNYNTIISNATFTVLDNPDLTVNYNETIYYGDDIILNVSLKSDATGNVEIHLGDKIYSSVISNGSAQFNISNVMPGVHIASVTYNGDENYGPKTIYAPLQIKKVSVNMNDAVYGWAKSISYQVKLIDEDGNCVSNKQVSFYINNKSFNVYTNANGIAKINLSLKIGKYDIKLSCQYANITKKITIVSRFRGNKNLTMYYFDGSRYAFKVIGNDGKLVGANQVVALKLNKKTYKVKTDKNGIVRFTIPKTVKPGKYTIAVTYKGQTLKNVLKVKKILITKKLFKVKKTAKKLVLVARLAKKLNKRPIIFRLNSKNYIAKTNKKGIAKLTIKQNVIKKLKKGRTYKLTILYYKTGLNTKLRVL